MYSRNLMMVEWQLLLAHVILFGLFQVLATPVSSPNWEELISTNGIKFTGRNAHASCVFKKRIWVTGGRTNSYTKYNLEESYKVADVWYSYNGAIWAQEQELTGDFFAQNIDAVQPGKIAPWYERYGHSLNAIDINNDGEEDLMVLAGGYASSPSNDVWVTEDGKHWVYTGLAPWSERAWHGAVVFRGKLWIMGGTPLNNEVWYLDKAKKVFDRPEPLTRAMYSNFTYKLEWKRVADPPWSPRVGMGLVSQFYFDPLVLANYSQSRERILMVGGYGGWPDTGPLQHLYDGFYCRGDSWDTYDGIHWRLLKQNNAFGGRAWMAMTVQRAQDPRYDSRPPETPQPPKIYLFGGGYIGFSTANKKRVNSMIGRADGYYTRDGANWTKINYEEGGGKTGVVYFSSQEWAKTVVDTKTKYLGLWGHTVHSFNLTNGVEYPGDLVLIAGDYTEKGDMSNIVYHNLPGLHCDIEGVICGGRGSCNATGCACRKEYEGTYCERLVGVIASGVDFGFFASQNQAATIGAVFVTLQMLYFSLFR